MRLPWSAISLKDRYRGALLGLACGDAVGTTVEFELRGSFEPVTGMRGGGPFGLRPGEWTDDTSMALCLAESLIECRGFDAEDQMTRYRAWWRNGYLSSTGTCFDIGNTTRRSLMRFEADGEPFAGATKPDEAGNGSLMRLAPVVLFYHPGIPEVVAQAARSSATTHGAPEAVDCCRLLAYAMSRALSGADAGALLDGADAHVSEPAVLRIAGADFRAKHRDHIRGSGYAVEALEAALWCVTRSRSPEEAILAAANLGDDADTTAAIAGQLAGALYGAGALPKDWLARLHLGSQITAFADNLLRLSLERQGGAST